MTDRNREKSLYLLNNCMNRTNFKTQVDVQLETGRQKKTDRDRQRRTETDNRQTDNRQRQT